MSRFTIWIPGVVAAAVALSAPAADEPKPAAPENIDAALQRVAPAIVKELDARGYKNVGVLKFRVADSDGVLRDNVGPLNRTLADRLEVALTLNLPDNDKKEDKDKLGIIAGASDAIARSGSKSANHATEKGRAKLFEVGADDGDPKLFRVPWKRLKGDEKILPDAFLTGEVRLSKDRMKADVKVLLFDKKDPAKVDPPIAVFTAASDARTLTDLGLTYSTRGGGVDFSKAVVLADKAAPAPDDKPEVLGEKSKEALKLFEKADVELQVFYDGERQKVEPNPGKSYSSNVLLRVNPPEQNQRVTFRLINRSKEDTYGVVLRVNGRNTIFEQRQDPASCYKWILEPGAKVEVFGFQRTMTKAAKFEVLSPSESKLEAVNYGDNAGTIDLVLFKGVPKPPEPKPPEAVALNTERAAIGKGAMLRYDEPAATDLRAFKSQLKDEGRKVTLEGHKGPGVPLALSATWVAGRKHMTVDSGRGGLLTSGGDEQNPVQEKKFYSGPYPSFSTTIRYYEVK
jgi:hypothetical protein